MQSNFNNSLSLICSCPFIPLRPSSTNWILSTGFSKKTRHFPASQIPALDKYRSAQIPGRASNQLPTRQLDEAGNPSGMINAMLGNTQFHHSVAWSFSKCTTNNNHGCSFINCCYSLKDFWQCSQLTLARLTKNLF